MPASAQLSAGLRKRWPTPFRRAAKPCNSPGVVNVSTHQGEFSREPPRAWIAQARRRIVELGQRVRVAVEQQLAERNKLQVFADQRLAEGACCVQLVPL